MKLWTLNKFLRRLGFVFVIMTVDTDDGTHTEIWFESAKSYDKRKKLTDEFAKEFYKGEENVKH